MKRRSAVRYIRRLCLVATGVAALYLHQRFEGLLIPGVLGGPPQRVLLDRWAEPSAVGGRFLYRDPAGLLSQGWLVGVAGEELILAPTPFIDPPENGARVHSDRIRGGVVLVFGSAKVPFGGNDLE